MMIVVPTGNADETVSVGTVVKFVFSFIAENCTVNASSLEMLTSFSPVNALNFCPFAAIASMEEPAD